MAQNNTIHNILEVVVGTADILAFCRLHSCKGDIDKGIRLLQCPGVAFRQGSLYPIHD